VIIKDISWERIRSHFTVEEKALIRETITGRVICPASTSIDIDRLPDDLQTKLTDLLKEDKKILKVGP
jgi:hypothetical protein